MAGRVGWLGKVFKPDSEKIAASIRRLEKFVTPDADRAERRFVEQFAAYRWDGSGLTYDLVRDISSSGFYLLTHQRWQPETILAFTLQREGPLDPDPARRITTQARVVRCGPDGVGLSFLWAKDDPESRQWDTLLDSLIHQTRPGDMQSLVRLVDAFAFLGRICPDGVDEIGDWVRTRASSHKVLNAVSIALKASEQLAAQSTLSLRVHPALAVHILDVGSGTHEEWLHRLWAGLLITSLSAHGRDQTNLEFIELFSQLTSIPIRVLTVVCTKSTKFITDSGTIAANPLACDTTELAATVSARGPQLARDLETLASLHLIEQSAASSPALLASSHTRITPTGLGLQLFALCNGHRGDLRDFYLSGSLETAAAAG